MIFAQTDIAHIKHAVFDGPMSAHQTQQVAGVCLVPPQRRDSKDGLDCGRAVKAADAREFEGLRNEWPFQKRIQPGTADQRPALTAAMSLVAAAGALAFRVCQALFTRGKVSCPQMPVQAQRATPADCL